MNFCSKKTWVSAPCLTVNLHEYPPPLIINSIWTVYLPRKNFTALLLYNDQRKRGATWYRVYKNVFGSREIIKNVQRTGKSEQKREIRAFGLYLIKFYQKDRLRTSDNNHLALYNVNKVYFSRESLKLYSLRGTKTPLP